MRVAIARTWERSTQVMALETCGHSSQRCRQSQRLRLKTLALRVLGPCMPGANPLTTQLTWEILGAKGLLTPRERGIERREEVA